MNNQSNTLWRWSRRWLPAMIIGLAIQVRGGGLQLGSVPDPSQAPTPGGNGNSWASVISPDGRYVLFASTADNLISNGLVLPPFTVFTVPNNNVFLRDRSNQTTILVSVNLAGTGGGNGDSFPVRLSTNGQYVLFESSASDLVAAGDTNNAPDIFRRDLLAGTTVLVSVGTNGLVGNGASRGAVMTPDGRYVAFASDASNLVPGDTNGIADVFVRDLQAGTTTLVSVGAIGSLLSTWGPTAGGSESPVITPDGRYVAFYSGATNLVAGVTNSGDIYVRDLVAGNTTWASAYARTAMQAALGVTNAIYSISQALSDDGQWLAYQANQGTWQTTEGLVLRFNLASGLTDVIHTNAVWRNGAAEDLRTLAMTPDGRFVAFLANTNGARSNTNDNCVLVWDGQAGTTTLASGNSNNAVPAGSRCAWPAISPDGRWVVFLSNATNLVANAPTNGYHVYMRDLQGGTTTLADANSSGVGSIVGSATVPQMTPDGRFVTFESPDCSLVANDRNRASDVFLRDLAAGTIELISARDPGLLPTLTANGLSQSSMLSLNSDGCYLAFVSDADNLVPGDTNGCRDVFVRDLLLGTNILVSVATNGGGDGLGFDPAISADGRYIAFNSSADNLVPGDTNNASDVFIRDLQTGTTTLVSTNISGTGSGNAASYLVAFSVNGRYVLFRSTASNLAPGSFSSENLFLRDLQAGTNYALTQSGDSFIYSGLWPNAMTPDGRFIIFYQSSYLGISVWNPLSGSTYAGGGGGVTALAMSPDGQRYVYCSGGTLYSNGTMYAEDRGASPNWNYSTYWPNWTSWTIGPVATKAAHPGIRFSGDGRFLVYVAMVNGTNQVYLHDMQYRTNLLVSHAWNSSSPGSGTSDWPEISGDGRFIAFRSTAPDLVPGDTNGVSDIFLYDRQNNTTTLVSLNRFGTAAGNNRSLAPAFSGDGQTLVFQSWASDLAAQDLSRTANLFVCRLYASGQVPVFAVSLSGSSQGPCLTWPVVSGWNYRVQYKTSLGDPFWRELNGNITILGSQGYLNDTNAGTNPRFYRVVAY